MSPARVPSLLSAALVALAGCGDDRAGMDADMPVDSGDPGPERFTVATWNVRDLFDDDDDPGRNDEILTTAQYQDKLRSVARVLRALDADIVALQEVENARVLDDLAGDHLPEAGYGERVLVEGDDPRGIDVAFLSRLPVERFASHLDDRFPSPDRTDSYDFARDALELFVRAGDETVIVTTVHFISMRDGDNEDRRLAEALHLRRIVDRRIENGIANVVIAGDLNDVPGSPTLQALTEDGGMTDLTTGVPAGDRWTFQFSGEERQLDHALGSPDMSDSVLADVRILHGPEVDAASDHEPVLATFDMSP